LATGPFFQLPSASLTDVSSAVCGGAFLVAGCLIRKFSKNQDHQRRWLTLTLMTGDLLKGAAFFPFVLLATSIANAHALELLAKSNRLVLFLSGMIAALYVLAEFIRSAQGPRPATPDDAGETVASTPGRGH
jgi:hypothetical protein